MRWSEELFCLKVSMSKSRLFKKSYALELIKLAKDDLETALALKKADINRKENILFHVQQAIEKAFLEWCQGVFFAGVYPKYADINQLSTAEEVKSFDDHAIYYTQKPDLWRKLPILKNRDNICRPSVVGKKLSPKVALRLGINRLTESGIRLLYKELTTIDALQSGVRVVRVLSPDLIPIHAHQNWPFMGGTACKIKARYSWATSNTSFPNHFPHPLG